VRATASTIPLIAADSDGASGTFVAWQEEITAGAGVLKVQHLLATGDLDPAWPADGAVASGSLVGRQWMKVLPDRLGGVYVTWTTQYGFAGTRIDPSGQVAGGWPTSGRFFGSASPATSPPSVIEDGAHGLYVAWVRSEIESYEPGAAEWMHVNSGNQVIGGWLHSTSVIDSWPQLALAPDGGVFLAWASWSDLGGEPNGWKLLRLTSAGNRVAGWPLEGLDFGPFNCEWVGTLPTSLVGLSPDARGGVFLLIANPIQGQPGVVTYTETRLYRRQGDGSTAPDWPEEGRLVQTSNQYYPYFPTGDAATRVIPDQSDGALVSTTFFYDHGVTVDFLRCSASGQWSKTIGGYLAKKCQIAPKHDGLFMALFSENGPLNPYDDPAFLWVDQWVTPPGWAVWREFHYEAAVVWYGDMALAPFQDDGAVLFWSQMHNRFGLFARRFSPAGQVTAVAADPPRALALGPLRFVPGTGVRAAITLPVATRGRLELFDLLGRRVAALDLDGAAQRAEVTLPGTATLGSGIYFARLATASQWTGARAVVAR
jgi:hypothetical protein